MKTLKLLFTSFIISFASVSFAHEKLDFHPEII